MTTIRDAILAAADHIEHRPDTFAFSSVFIPAGKDCGTPGCALGWIGSFLELRDEMHITWNPDADSGRKSVGLCDIVFVALGYPKDACHSKNEFYERLEEACAGWRHSAVLCAKALRLYADKYHPASPLRINTAPDWRALATAPPVGEADTVMVKS